MLLALCALGAVWDLLHPRPELAPPAERWPLATAVAAPAASATAPARTAPGLVPATPLDLNRATAAELDALPGIGPVLASRIVEHRAAAGPFRSADELLSVRGIGPHLLERLRPLVRAGAAPAAPGRTTVQNAIRPER